jgi:hypothetical protein
MSAFGTKRTSEVRRSMSAFWCKADNKPTLGGVCKTNALAVGVWYGSTLCQPLKTPTARPKDPETEAIRWFETLTPSNQDLVRQVMQQHPALTLAEALAALDEAGM